MATLRSYSATFEQTALAGSAVARYRFNEGAGSDALDNIADLDGTYESGAAPGVLGSIGDGAASYDGATGFVLVETLSGAITVSAFGDSLMVVDPFSPNLEAALEARGLEATVINRAIGGHTSAEGLARIDDVIDDEPDVVIVEFGTNDALQERPIGDAEQDLREIITQLRSADIQVLVTGTFGWYPDRHGGGGYDTAEERDAFEAIFADLVAEFDDPGVVLLQDRAGSNTFLGGERDAGDVADLDDDIIVGGVLDGNDPSLQYGFPDDPDGLHPNADGTDFIVPRTVPQTIALGVAAGAVVDGLALASGSFEIWFTTDAIGQRQTLFSKNASTAGAGRISAQLREDGNIAIIISSGGTSEDSELHSAPGLVQAGASTHVVATFGDGGMQLFVDGALIDSADYDGGIDTAEPLVIGAETGFSSPGATLDNLARFFQGTIDEFAVYDRALTGEEVTRLFEGGALGTEVVGTADADRIIGGSDDEELRGAAGDDIIEGRDGADALRGGTGVDLLRGGQGGDVLVGGAGDDVLQGGAGADSLSGAGGADELFGNQGADQLSGGRGADLLNGGKGSDNLTGGAGSDTFQIDRLSHGVDKIFDFEDGVGGDVLDLSAVLAFDDGDDVVDFVRLDEVGSNTSVEVDANGGGDNFTAVFNLIGVNGLDIANLVSDGNLQLTSTPS